MFRFQIQVLNLKYKIYLYQQVQIQTCLYLYSHRKNIQKYETSHELFKILRRQQDRLRSKQTKRKKLVGFFVSSSTCYASTFQTV